MRRSPAVLCIGAGLLQTYAIRTIQALGYAALCTDRDTTAPGVSLADAFYPVDTYDAAATAALMPHLAERWDVRGVIAPGIDVAPTAAMAAAAAAAHLPGIPYDVACLTHDKARVRYALAEAGLDRYQPRWLVCGPGAYGIDQGLDSVRYPCVVKPLEQRASRGVTLVLERRMLAPALDKVLQFGDYFLLESMLRGTEHSAEMLLDGQGHLLWWNIVDRQFRYREGLALETGHTNPTTLPLHLQEAVQEMVCAAATACGVTWGPFKADVMVTANGPKILEVTARLSGGFDCQVTSPLTGRQPLRQLVQLACGEPVEGQPLAQGYAACAAIVPSKSGWLAALPANAQIAPIVSVVWAIAPGTQLAPPQHNAERLGYVFATASTSVEAWAIAAGEAARLAHVIDQTLASEE